MYGIPYEWAEVIVGVVMLLYVLFGGMLATTWVQIIKAVLLLIGVTILTIIVLAQFNFNPVNIYERVSTMHGQGVLEPGGLISKPLDAISLGLALMLGVLGLPHILQRFYTVPDAKAARKSLLYGAGMIGFFYIIIPIVGFGAMALVGKATISKVDAGGNMAAPLIAELLGGTPFLGLIAAVAFATILAVVAGLTLAGATSFSHDLYANVIKNGKASEKQQVRVAKISTIIFGIVAVLLGISFKGQNVAFMVGLAFSIAASANFPALLMSVIWKRFTTAGAVASIFVGAVLSILLIILGPTVWEGVFKNAAGSAPFPLKNPTVISMPAAFIIGIIVSLCKREKDAEAKYEEEKLRTYLGVGAE